MKKQRRGKKKLRKEMIVSVSASASASAGATLPNLPNEIKDEIFSRLPVKTLLDFRCVSRDYYSPFHNPNFIKLHLNRQMEMDNGSTIIIPYGNMIHKVNIDKFRYVIPLDFPSLKSTSTSPIVVAGSYNGLVCLTHDPLDEDIYLPSSSCFGEIAYLWNPVTGDYKQLPAHNNDVSPYYRIALGFGYDRNSGKFKVLVSFFYDEENVDYDEEEEDPPGQVKAMCIHWEQVLGEAFEEFSTLFGT